MTIITDEEAYFLLINNKDVCWMDNDAHYHRIYYDSQKNPNNHGYMKFNKFPDIIRFCWEGKRLK